MKTCLRRLALFLCLAGSLPVIAAPMVFIHPPPENPGDLRHTYYWEILDAALQANRAKYGEYQIIPYEKPMNFQRAAAEVEAGEKGRVNIVARATNLDLETRLRPVFLPLDKGLLGYRLFLILPETQAKLDATVRSIDELKRFTIGQASPGPTSRFSVTTDSSWSLPTITKAFSRCSAPNASTCSRVARSKSAQNGWHTRIWYRA